MGALPKLYDSILFVSFLIHALAPPLIGAQLLLPRTLFPDLLIDFKNHYIRQSGDYLMAEAPHFFIGLLWLELLLQWPLTLLNLYAISTAKPWLHTTCLIYGVSLYSAMAAIAAELIGSQRASGVMLSMYLPFLGLGVFAHATWVAAVDHQTRQWTINCHQKECLKKRNDFLCCHNFTFISF